VAKLSTSDKDSTEFYEVLTSEALALPADVPIRGPGGELIPHAVAHVYMTDDGTLMAIMRIPGKSKVTAILSHRNALSVKV
jgi:hypothetical protein